MLPDIDFSIILNLDATCTYKKEKIGFKNFFYIGLIISVYTAFRKEEASNPSLF